MRLQLLKALDYPCGIPDFCEIATEQQEQQFVTLINWLINFALKHVCTRAPDGEQSSNSTDTPASDAMELSLSSSSSSLSSEMHHRAADAVQFDFSGAACARRVVFRRLCHN